MIASKNHIQSMNVDTIYFGHYGASSHVTEVYNQLEHWLPIFVQTGKEVFDKYNDFDEATKALQTLLMDKISSHLTKLNVPSDHSVYNILHLDIEISAMGIIDYFTKQEKQTPLLTNSKEEIYNSSYCISLLFEYILSKGWWNIMQN